MSEFFAKRVLHYVRAPGREREDRSARTDEQVAAAVGTSGRT